ncbi:Undecaprenyl-diphosphatase [Porphyromonas levii]|uniref:undecaprenyl-diphosphatase UppP n=1 Tax=Porphyromonas levii TaxID=28114 RepID=UPI001B8BF8D4|nr:undecaprenyl-diphosphatase UppP [Porphyromonas levii]MBR8758890.1 Undecaprenyl-diphosphatase [Porphyromonas levii]MBR8784223.1 Undecaprenyl-diphosphatase [Porphyromonas levii]
MTIFEAIVLAIVEGITEFLPISSTGHMVITQALMGIESTEYVKAFTVMIQFGAILSVVALYFKRFFRFELPADMWHGNHSNARRALSRFRFYFLLIAGVVPAAILGLLFNDWVDEALGEVWIIATNLVIGGIVMLFIDKLIKHNHSSEVTYPKSFIIGLFQTIAMFLPGMSRSMSTIVGGMVTGLKRETAAEFSFFLAVPTMLGAFLLQIIKFWKVGTLNILTDNMTTLIIGNVVSFIVAMIAIKTFIKFLQKHGFVAFGIYRIIIGGVILGMIALGMDLAVFQ